MFEPVEVPKACPHCGQQGELWLVPKLAARPIGSFSLSGAQMKFSANERVALECSLCEFSMVGHLAQESGKNYFVAERQEEQS